MIQQCSGCAGPGQQGLILTFCLPTGEVLRCVTTNMETKQNKNQNKKKNTKVESKFLKFTKNCENFQHMMFEYQTQRFLKL